MLTDRAAIISILTGSAASGPATYDVQMQFLIGTAKKQDAIYTCFWQCDLEGEFRTGKLMQYRDDCHRLGKPLWAHKEIPAEEFNLVQVFYGEHQVRQQERPGTLGIVEAEKTAVVAYLHRPDLHWMAAGAMTHLNDYKINRVKSQYDQIILFPDSSPEAWDRWEKIAMKHGLSINTALGKSRDGIDIADVLLNPRYSQDLAKTMMTYNKEYI